MSVAHSHRTDLTARLRAYILVEGQEGLQVRDALMKEAASEIDRLRSQVKEMAQEIRDTARGAADEARWQERQGGEYGSY